jgi:hypothetical protein
MWYFFSQERCIMYQELINHIQQKIKTDPDFAAELRAAGSREAAVVVIKKAG